VGLTLHGYEAAFLIGGPRATSDAVLAQLTASGSLAIIETRAVQGRPLPASAHPLEQAVHREVVRRGEIPLTELQTFADSSTGDLAARLRGLGLTEASTMSGALLLVLVVPSLLVGAAIVGRHGVFPAFLGFAIAYVVGHVCLSNPTGMSALGILALKKFRQDYEYLRESSAREPVVRSGLLAAAIALSGLDALRRLELAEVADALTLARATSAAEACTHSNGCGCG
jgi:uncharacterized protein (TIGR04222 family)